jgi:hypothetical protein
MPQPTQTAKSHTRWFPPFHFFVIPVLLINVLNSLRHIYQDPSLHTAWAAVVAAALMGLAASARTMTMTVQDRIIRLEMQLRLMEILPVDLRGRIGDITREQFVALRFASDEEMSDLVRDVLAGNLAKPRAIKERVKTWKSDYLRA